MVRLLLFIFLSVSRMLSAQPVSESSVYIYNKERYSFDFFNNYSPISIMKDGSVWCQSFGKPYVVIGSNTAKHPLYLKNEMYSQLYHVFEWNGKQIICTETTLFVLKNQQLLQTVKLPPQPDSKFSDFLLHQNKIYFYAKNVLYVFDGDTIFQVKNSSYFRGTITLHKHNNELYVIEMDGKYMNIYSVNNQQITTVRKIPSGQSIMKVLEFSDTDHFLFVNHEAQLIQYEKGIFQLKQQLINNRHWWDNMIYFHQNIDNHKYLYLYSGSFDTVANTGAGGAFFFTSYSKESNSYYCATSTNLIRIFPHIKKYPRLFSNNHSNSIFALQQDNMGRIWAGSYGYALSLIESNNNTVVQRKETDLLFLNGGVPVKDKVLLFAEGVSGLRLFKDVNFSKKLSEDSIPPAYYGYISRDKKFYIGTHKKGLWHTPFADIENERDIKWTKISRAQGLNIENTLTVSEDRYANVWTAGPRAIAVYNPDTKTAITWELEKTNLPFIGARAMMKDNRGTLWIGARDGSLVYYEGKNKTDFHVENFKQIKHPFFESGKEVSFMKQWGDFVVLGMGGKVLLFDLKKWYRHKKAYVRYLNPMEINLTASTEQNSCLTDFRDSSFWFSSGDMLYQVDLKKWLNLPTFYAKPSIIIQQDSTEIIRTTQNEISFKPTKNSFHIQIHYQTKDNMPRFLNGVLVKEGEEPVFGQPNLEDKFHFTNLSPGKYSFYVRICQQDGSFSIVEFPIIIQHFLWQNWWFWALLSLIPVGFILIYYKKQSELEQQTNKITRLNLTNLSNQFRPHFMLNALNSIGSQMNDMPHAEKVISRLGESINILYGFTQKNEYTHFFESEWMLVENIIEIQRILFIPELRTEITGKEIIPPEFRIPVGLLQIPIENALLHGLRNKTNLDCKLQIEIKDIGNEYMILISDNGVGRKKANMINRQKKHGNGLKTIFEMITIINRHQKKAIQFSIIDLSDPDGTIVIIHLSKKIDYVKINLL